MFSDVLSSASLIGIKESCCLLGNKFACGSEDLEGSIMNLRANALKSVCSAGWKQGRAQTQSRGTSAKSDLTGSWNEF